MKVMVYIYLSIVENMEVTFGEGSTYLYRAPREVTWMEEQYASWVWSVDFLFFTRI